MSDNFSGKRFLNKAEGFVSPTELPADAATAKKWQEANKTWWESTPMRYDWREEVAAEPGTKGYFDEIDRRFFGSVQHYMPWQVRPFDNLIDFSSLHKKDVLEIGVGQGSHAQLIAPHCKSFVGIDLTEAASSITRQRLESTGIEADIRQMDAEDMAFDDASFDYIWSWGVIHHSSDTGRILNEMHRVLRPGGSATVMVYHRSWFYYVNGLIRGVLRGDFRRYRSFHEVMQASTDGAIARHYTPDEWRALCNGMFNVDEVKITGLKSDALPLPASSVKTQLERTLPDAMTRTMTDFLRMGTFLIAHMSRA